MTNRKSHMRIKINDFEWRRFRTLFQKHVFGAGSHRENFECSDEDVANDSRLM